MRVVTVGFRGANNKLEQISTTIPADWVTGERDALTEVYDNQKLRTRLSVAPNNAVWAEISDPFDDQPGTVRVSF